MYCRTVVSDGLLYADRQMMTGPHGRSGQTAASRPALRIKSSRRVPALDQIAAASRTSPPRRPKIAIWQRFSGKLRPDGCGIRQARRVIPKRHSIENCRTIPADVDTTISGSRIQAVTSGRFLRLDGLDGQQRRNRKHQRRDPAADTRRGARSENETNRKGAIRATAREGARR